MLSRIVASDETAMQRLADAGVEIVVDLAGYERLLRDGGEAAWHEAVRDIDGMIVGLQDVDRSLLESAPGLRYVLRIGTGTDNMDFAAAAERGVEFANLPGLNAEAVAELAFTLLLAAAKRIPEGHDLVRSGGWGRFTGRHLGGRTLGLVGYGAIARLMVPKARGFELDVLVHRRSGGTVTEDGIPVVPLDELIERSDFLSIHVPLTEDTRHLIGAREIGLMHGTVLVNTARGEVVDEQALYDGLVNGNVFAAGLDVFSNEPPAGSPLLTLPNVVLAPHNGGYSDLIMSRIAAAAVDFALARTP
jgi:D-3-phosphoglycerate dehydrogenase